MAQHVRVNREEKLCGNAPALNLRKNHAVVTGDPASVTLFVIP
jgi:hypothetical protein